MLTMGGSASRRRVYGPVDDNVNRSVDSHTASELIGSPAGFWTISMNDHAIRVSKTTHDVLRDLAARSKTSIGVIVDQAVEEFQRKRFWEEYNDGYAKLASQPEAWRDYQEEVRTWETTLDDGLEDKPDEQRQRQRRSRAR
jgi:hypothetical protein